MNEMRMQLNEKWKGQEATEDYENLVLLVSYQT